MLVGFIKGKSAIHIVREVEGRARGYAGQSFWARGYFVSTVGRDEKVIREYIRNHCCPVKNRWYPWIPA